MTRYTQEYIDKAFDEICDKIAQGYSLRSLLIAPDSKIKYTKFYELLDRDESKANKYARACNIRAEMKFESINQDYSEEPQRDPLTGKIDPAWVNLQRLKIDSKKWELSKLMPKKYGDKLDIDHTSGGDKIEPVRIVFGKNGGE